MSEFSQTVNEFKTRKKKKGGEIEIEEWLKHFKKLLGEEEGTETEKEIK